MTDIKIISCGKKTISGLSINIENPSQKHAFYILFMPFGKATVSFNDDTYTLKSGDFVIACPQDTLCYSMSRRAKSKLYYVEFVPEDKEAFLDKYKLKNGIFHSHSEKDVRTAFAFLLNEHMIKSEFYEFRINAFFTQLMCTLSASRALPDPYFEQIRKLAADINNDFRSTAIDVTPYADKVKLSKDRFSVIFKKHFAYPPHHYHIMLKMNEAQFLLKSSNLSIGEISDYLGFSNQLYFSTAYKKHMGETPSQTRKKHH